MSLAHPKNKSLWEALSSPANFPNYDSRNDLGLGKTQPKFHLNRQSGPSYPYKEPPESEFEGDEDEDEFGPDSTEDPTEREKFRNKLGDVKFSDPLSVRSVDNQYYTPGASTRFDMAKLGEAIAPYSTRGTISPFPNLYKNKQGVVGGAASWNASHKDIQHTRGTKRGYAGAQKPVIDVPNSWEDEKNDEDDPVSKIRRIVNAYHELNLLSR